MLDVEVRSTLEFDVITMNIHFLSEDVIVYFSIIRGGSSMPEHKGKLNRSKIRKDRRGSFHFCWNLLRQSPRAQILFAKSCTQD